MGLTNNSLTAITMNGKNGERNPSHS